MSILTTAEELINGQRAQDYGDAWENHVRIARLWQAYKPGYEFSAEDVAVMMILLKIARFMENGYHHDTVTDIAGYAGVLEKLQPTPPQGVKPLEPRKFQWLSDVPEGVAVIDKDGDYWSVDQIAEEKRIPSAIEAGRHFLDTYAPFTEHI